MRTERWKYIRTYEIGNPAKVAFEELYDLAQDPHEMSNLAAEEAHAAVVRDLADRLKRHREVIGRGN